MLNFKQQDYGTDCAWDIVTGCSKCAPACKHCHVLRCKTKYPEVKFHAEKLESPLYAVIPLLINVAPNGDLFHPEINKKQLFKIFDVIKQTPQHQYLILTRRPQRINKLKLHIPDNVWLGVSIADKNEWSLFNELKSITATTKVVALAPATNHYNQNMPFEGISWVIIAPDNRRSRKATPCSIDTVEQLIHNCFSRKIPYYLEKSYNNSRDYACYSTNNRYPVLDVMRQYFQENAISLCRPFWNATRYRKWGGENWRDCYQEHFSDAKISFEELAKTCRKDYDKVKLLGKLLRVIHRKKTSPFERGKRLAQIRDDKLYKALDFKSFDDFCKQRIKLNHAHIYRLIFHYQLNARLLNEKLKILPEQQSRQLRTFGLEEAVRIAVKYRRTPKIELEDILTELNESDSTQTVIRIGKRTLFLSDENLWHQEIVKFAGGNIKTAVAVCERLQGVIEAKVTVAIIRDVFKEHCAKLTQSTLNIGIEIDDSFIRNLLDQQTGQSKPV